MVYLTREDRRWDPVGIRITAGVVQQVEAPAAETDLLAGCVAVERLLKVRVVHVTLWVLNLHCAFFHSVELFINATSLASYEPAGIVVVAASPPP
jgi:hypothetical protein